MWQKYTKFERLKCGKNIQNWLFRIDFPKLLDDSQAKLKLRMTICTFDPIFISGLILDSTPLVTIL